MVRIQNNRAEPIATGLNRPDGLLLRGKYLYVTEEVAEGRVLKIELASGKQVLATLHNPEGIDILRNGNLVITEDVNGGL